MKPIYAENIVVAIRYEDRIEWYILDKDYCFLITQSLKKRIEREDMMFIAMIISDTG